MNKKQIWETVLGELEVVLSKANFTTWFKDTFIYNYDGKTTIIGVPNSFTREWLKNKYNKQILEVLKKQIATIETIEYKVISDKNNIPKYKADIKTPNKVPIDIKSDDNFRIEHKYTFNNFIVGNSNRLAYATAQAIAQEPGKKYNPFFIYGGVGLGKTHLMQAIGNHMTEKNKNVKVIYIPCEEFTNEYVNSIQNKTVNKFKNKYRKADLLLVDDIQFLSGKEGTQEEFFHTFNTLHRAGRQIILSADRRPQDLPEVAGRLTSRFAWGMVADIMPPDLETRKAILSRKSEEKLLDLDTEMIEYIAQNIESNIRELEGALNKIKTHLDIYQKPLSLNLITEILQENINNSRTKNISGDKIIKAVSSFFSIEKKEILGKRRYKELVYPRQIIMYLLRNELNYSFPRIGKELGGKDHTTIMHGVEKIAKQIKRDNQLQNELSLIKEKLYI
jgi:chromosomal replication initiator protein